MRIIFPLCLLAAFCLAQQPRSPWARPDTPREEGMPQAWFAPDSTPHHMQNMLAQWLKQLSPGQRQLAQALLREFHPEIHALRTRIMEKKAELAAFCYDSHTPPETLPRIGLELRRLRESLQQTLDRLDMRSQREVGVSLGPLYGNGRWLAPASDNLAERLSEDVAHTGARLDHKPVPAPIH